MSLLGTYWRFLALVNPKLVPKLDPENGTQNQEKIIQHVLQVFAKCLAIVRQMLESLLGSKNQWTKLHVTKKYCF